MKKITQYLTVFMLATLIVSCNQKKIDQLSADNQTLSSEKDSLNSNLQTYMQTFNEIEKNLEEIKKREDKINLKTDDNVEFKEDDSKTAVVNDIRAINALMKDNRDKMAELQTKLSSTSAEFKKMVSRLNNRINAKDKELVAMKTELEQLNIEKDSLNQNVQKLAYSVDTLSNKTKLQTKVIDAQNEKIDNQVEALNTGFVAIGTYKDLKDDNIIDKEGGVLGLGRTETVSPDLNKESFEKIDVSKTTAIPVFAKKVELVSKHPTGSYELSLDEDEKVQQLTILDPVEFWKSSKYLVVMVD